MAGGTGNQYRNFVWNCERWNGFALRSDDIIISTAPKCGTTWMQMQCALLLFRTADLPAPLATLSPWLDMNTRPKDEVWAALAGQAHRRFIKTHTLLDGLPWDDDVTYVHVGRDPRDAGLSMDNHMANMDRGRLFELRVSAVGMDDFEELGIEGPQEMSDDPVERFWRWIDGDTGGGSDFESLVGHSRSFWEARDRPNVHLFHYAQQRADLATQMARLAEVLDVESPTPQLVAAAGFEAMKAQADQLVPNSDTSFWLSHERFFDKARHRDWEPLMAGDGAARYDAALRRVTDDEPFIEWLHQDG
jgi:aryl sulfotransferase